MKGILDGIKGIFDMIVMLKDFVVNIIKSLFELIKLLISTQANVSVLIATLPPWLIAAATATLSVCILYLIIGRESGK